MRSEQIFIDGHWRPSSKGRVYAIRNPSTGQAFARVGDADIEDMRSAISAARTSFDRGDWRFAPMAERISALRSLASGLRARRDRLARLLIEAHGIDHSVLDFNLDAPIANVDAYADAALRYELDRPLPSIVAASPVGGASSVVNAMVHRQPVGVCGLIPTWNFPLFITVNKIAPALAMGCSVVVKPSPLGPLIDLQIAEVLEEVGLPAGVFNVVTGSGPDLGDELARNRDVDMIGFTGSASVGRKIMETAGRTLKRLHLELGGKSAMLVCPDAELEAVAPAASAAAYYRAGQACALLTRVLVHRSQHDELVAKMAAFVDQYVRVGDASDPEVTMGPLISKDRLEGVEAMVERAVRDGARIVRGGKRLSDRGGGFFYEATILSDVSPSMPIAQEEIFGPVVCTIPYDDLDQAIAIANDCEYGLSGGIVSADTGAAIELAKRLRTGEVVINGGNHPYAPFGGFKQSGLGREMMEWGFDAFSELQTISWST